MAILFNDRAEAGGRLAAKLKQHALADPVVYALPRGGVPVALEVAKALGAPLDLILVRKIPAPGSPELALAAVVEGDPPQLVINEKVRRMTSPSDDYLAEQEREALEEIERRRVVYLAGRPRPDPRGRTAVVVDDGVATGSVAIAAVGAMRRAGAGRVIVAVPIAAPDAALSLRKAADEVVTLAEPSAFWGVGGFYADFHQLSDEEVLGQLAQAPAPAPAPAPGGKAESHASRQ